MEATITRRIAKLIMVSEANNNKFYNMEQLDEETFEVRYGRIGSHPMICTYPLQQWEKKYREKVRKGYRDVSSFSAEREGGDVQYAIDNPAVRRLIRTLTHYAHRSIFANYMVTAEDVTLEQVEEAQSIIDEISGMLKKGAEVQPINRRLIELFTIIPRRMSQVNDHLVDKLDSKEAVTKAESHLADEQATLDVMAGQVKTKSRTVPGEHDEPATLLDALGLVINPVADAREISRVKKQMADQAKYFGRLFSVKNVRTQRAFDRYVTKQSSQKTKLLWHGSRNENWLSILESGLVLRPANAIITGKMFGYGLYFADRCEKSLNYTSLRGSCWTAGSAARAYLALYDVHVGKQMIIRKHDASCYDLNANKLKRRWGLRKKQYDSVFAKGGADLRNNEFIVYRNQQCTVKYLVELNH